MIQKTVLILELTLSFFPFIYNAILRIGSPQSDSTSGAQEANGWREPADRETEQST